MLQGCTVMERVAEDSTSGVSEVNDDTCGAKQTPPGKRQSGSKFGRLSCPNWVSS